MSTIDLFGDSFVESPNFAKIEPLSETEVNTAMEVLPDILLDQLINATSCLRNEKLKNTDRNIRFDFNSLGSKNDHYKITEAQKRFLSEIYWVYDLGKSTFPFDAACGLATDPVDPEVVRNGLSAEFGDEIRLLIKIVSNYDLATADHIRRKVRSYIVLNKE